MPTKKHPIHSHHHHKRRAKKTKIGGGISGLYHPEQMVYKVLNPLFPTTTNIYQYGNQPPSQPPVTEPPITQPPITQPPITQPPITQPPITQPPITQPPITQPPITQYPELPGPTEHPGEIPEGTQTPLPGHGPLPPLPYNPEPEPISNQGHGPQESKPLTPEEQFLYNMQHPNYVDFRPKGSNPMEEQFYNSLEHPNPITQPKDQTQPKSGPKQSGEAGIGVQADIDEILAAGGGVSGLIGYLAQYLKNMNLAGAKLPGGYTLGDILKAPEDFDYLLGGSNESLSSVLDAIKAQGGAGNAGSLTGEDLMHLTDSQIEQLEGGNDIFNADDFPENPFDDSNEVPKMEPPKTEPPTTEPPTTEPPATKPPTTEPPPTQPINGTTPPSTGAGSSISELEAAAQAAALNASAVASAQGSWSLAAV